MNMHTCAKFGPDRSGYLAYFPHLCMCDPLTPSKYPLGLDRLIVFSRCPFADESAYVCQIWSRSVQWFATVKVSSVLNRCRRWLVQKHAKKQLLYIENYNFSPTILTTSLSFFTAIFVPFRGTLPELLMVMCRHVTTELYIYFFKSRTKGSNVKYRSTINENFHKILFCSYAWMDL